MEEKYFSVSLKTYLKANGGKINPDRTMVFSYYTQFPTHTHYGHGVSTMARFVKQVQIGEDGNTCMGIEQPSEYVKGGEMLQCEMFYVRVEMPLNYLEEKI